MGETKTYLITEAATRDGMAKQAVVEATNVGEALIKYVTRRVEADGFAAVEFDNFAIAGIGYLVAKRIDTVIP